MSSLVGKNEHHAEYVKITEELVDNGWFLPTKPKITEDDDFPDDLSEAEYTHLGRLLGKYAGFESFARAKTGIAQAVMVMFKEYALEDSDEEVSQSKEVIPVTEARGRISARMNNKRQIYKAAEADYRKFDAFAESYRNLKDAISREISRRDVEIRQTGLNSRRNS